MRHMGIINSDEIVGRYLDAVERYAVVTQSRVPLYRRIWRWVLTQIGY